MTKTHHPDVDSSKAEEFKKINEAYSVLSDETKKKQYDMQGSRPSGYTNQRTSSSNPYTETRRKSTYNSNNFYNTSQSYYSREDYVR